MILRYFFSVLAFLMFVLSPISAQNIISDSLLVSSEYADSLFLSRYTDSLATGRVRIDSVYNKGAGGSDVSFYRLFITPTFYYGIASETLSLEGGKRADKTQLEEEIDATLLNLYLSNPHLIKGKESDISQAGQIKEDISEPIMNTVELVEKIDDADTEDLELPMEVVVRKPNFWTFSGDYYLQFLQNYVSGNWYKGGESNYSMVASATLQANYNNKQKVKFDNKLEMKLGFQTSKGDSLHSFKTSEDLIRYTGKLGLQATKRWYYTLQLVAYTQFMRGYKSNDPFVYSDILSPLNVNLSLGMDYNVEAFGKRLTGNVHLAPLAYNFRYVGREALATRYGLDEGSRTMHDFGSELTVDLTWKFSDMIKWKTRLYGYTTYERAEIEWENTITLQFNRYISSNIFIYPRFDDGAKRDDDHGYWQFKEYASIGFSYSF